MSKFGVLTLTGRLSKWKRENAKKRVFGRNFRGPPKSQKRLFTTSKTFPESAETNCEWKKNPVKFAASLRPAVEKNRFREIPPKGLISYLKGKKCYFPNEKMYELQTLTNCGGTREKPLVRIWVRNDDVTSRDHALKNILQMRIEEEVDEARSPNSDHVFSVTVPRPCQNLESKCGDHAL